MKEYIVTDAFQYRGNVWRKGETIRLSDAEAATPFVKAHVAAVPEAAQAAGAQGARREGRPAPVLTNGVPVKPKRGNRPKV